MALMPTSGTTKDRRAIARDYLVASGVDINNPDGWPLGQLARDLATAHGWSREAARRHLAYVAIKLRGERVSKPGSGNTTERRGRKTAREIHLSEDAASALRDLVGEDCYSQAAASRYVEEMIKEQQKYK